MSKQSVQGYFTCPRSQENKVWIYLVKNWFGILRVLNQFLKFTFFFTFFTYFHK